MSERLLSIPHPCPSAGEFRGQLWSNEGSRSLSFSGGVLVVGEDTSNENSKEDQEPLSLILTSCQDILFHERRVVARGGRRYSSPLAKG